MVGIQSHFVVLQMMTAGVERTRSVGLKRSQGLLLGVDIEVYSDDLLRMDHILGLDWVVLCTDQYDWDECLRR